MTKTLASSDSDRSVYSLLLNASEVSELVGGGVSVRSVWRWVSDDKFPKPVQLGGRTLWRRRDVEIFVGAANGSMTNFRRITRGNK